ncbi:hypothetical protein [Streptomyces coeruleorubidus]|uniref:hypothetical protein n=1 Tax=Streptomyces coeruleorubidus TaxID=116188 RepID=UPI003406FBDC
MLDSKKIAAAAGVLCSFALLSVGAGQAFGHDASAGCVQDGKSKVRCVQESEYRVTSDERGNVSVSNKQSQECSSGTCVSRFHVGGAKKDS